MIAKKVQHFGSEQGEKAVDFTQKVFTFFVSVCVTYNF